MTLQLTDLNKSLKVMGLAPMVVEGDSIVSVPMVERESNQCVHMLERGACWLAKADSIQQTKDVLDVAKVANEWAEQRRLSKECIKKDKSILTYALHKLGQQLQATPRNRGAAGIGTNDVEHNDSTPPTLAELGISRDLSSKAQKLANLSQAQVDAIAEGAGKPRAHRKTTLTHERPGPIEEGTNIITRFKKPSTKVLDHDLDITIIDLEHLLDRYASMYKTVEAVMDDRLHKRQGGAGHT